LHDSGNPRIYAREDVIDSTGSLRLGVDYYEEYSASSSALVFPDFEIPELDVKQVRKLEVPAHAY